MRPCWIASDKRFRGNECTGFIDGDRYRAGDTQDKRDTRYNKGGKIHFRCGEGFVVCSLGLYLCIKIPET